MDNGTLPQRKALITGAGQGIGRACALALAQAGIDLYLLDRNEETLAAVLEEVRGTGVRAEPIGADLLDQEGSARAVREVVERHGPVSILVNNAGFDRPGTAARISLDDFQAVLAIHLTAALNMAQQVLPGMSDQGWGRIINISSIYGERGAKGEIAYVTAKAGLIGLTRSLALEAGPKGITVNAILPGLTRTPTIENVMAEKYKEAIIAVTPLGRIGEAGEIAQVVAFLASEGSSFISGAAIPVSGGWGV
jgi:NAD(P)-dependent dehydrogenase (short-subunit alcohol dehydrogenase family)